jgi:hypothetical protein
VKTVDDLDAYIVRCKRHYWGVSKDTQFLHWLIDKELAVLGEQLSVGSGPSPYSGNCNGAFEPEADVPPLR